MGIYFMTMTTSHHFTVLDEVGLQACVMSANIRCEPEIQPEDLDSTELILAKLCETARIPPSKQGQMRSFVQVRVCSLL